MRQSCLVLLISLLVLLAGCDQSSQVQQQQQQRQARDHLVELYPVSYENVKLDRTRTGTLRATKRFRVFAQEEGQIADLPWYPGDRVNQQDLLMRLDDSLLRSQISRSQAELNRAERDLERARSLSQRNLTSVEELQRRETEMEKAKADLSVLTTRSGFTRVDAPFSGVITERLSEPGSFASKNTHLLTLIDPDSIVIDIAFSEQVISQLSIEDEVEVRIDALGSEAFTGHISRIYPEIDPLTRRGQVEVSLNPVPSGALPGQLARVSLTANLQQRMMIPFSAVRVDQQEYVYVMSDDKIVKRKPVTTGLRVADRIEIVDGLKAGDQVVIRGFMGLSEGRQVTPVTPLSERGQ